MKIICHGAAGTVTGSCHLVETDSVRFLIDCGMFQGSKDLNRINFQEFAFEPASIDFLILTHAHADHCGLLPKLVKDGFSGPIYLTPPSADLLPVMLDDSAFIQEHDTEDENRRRQRMGLEPREPLYTRDDAALVYPLMEAVKYDEVVEVAEGLSFRLRNAGHVIGSASVEIFETQAAKTHTVVFSGDLGQWNAPILQDPTLILKADQVFMESTYGDRLHGTGANRKEELKNWIVKTVKRGGKVLIPAFSLERTQELLYILSGLVESDPEFPKVPIYLDSPLSIKITQVFKTHTEAYDEEAAARRSKLFEFPGLICTSRPEESQKINKLEGPAVIIAGSGMCTGGRIRHHIKHHIWDPRNTILFVGYQGAGTLGRIILDGAKEIKMMGGYFAVKAEVGRISSFSGHADQNELIKWLNGFNPKPQKLFLIHGDESTMETFSKILKEQGHSVTVPRRGQVLNVE